MWYLITLIGLLAVGLTISTLMVATKEEARASRRSEANIAALYALTKSLAAESRLDRIVDVLERHVLETFRRPIIRHVAECWRPDVCPSAVQVGF